MKNTEDFIRSAWIPVFCFPLKPSLKSLSKSLFRKTGKIYYVSFLHTTRPGGLTGLKARRESPISTNFWRMVRGRGMISRKTDFTPPYLLIPTLLPWRRRSPWPISVNLYPARPMRIKQNAWSLPVPMRPKGRHCPKMEWGHCQILSVLLRLRFM